MKSLVTKLIALAVSAGVCVVVALWAVGWIERRSHEDVVAALEDDGHFWAEVESDGLRLVLGGTAPDEPARFRALSVAGGIVEGSRLVDAMEVAPPDEVEAPEYQVEILRNGDDVSLIGLLPSMADRDALRDTVRRLSGSALFTDLLETADGAHGETWDAALQFGLESAAMLSRSKVSVTAERVSVDALVSDGDEKRRVEATLSDGIPHGIALAMNIEAPRPVVTPFTARFLIDEEGARFDACTASTDEGANTILRAAKAAGLTSEFHCTLALGSPAVRWAEAVARAIQAVAALGGGDVTFSDGDVTLIAPQGTDPELYDAEIGALEQALPPVFSLHAVLPVIVDEAPEAGGEGPARFSANRTGEGTVQLRGRLGQAIDRRAVEGFALARFGANETTTGIRIDDSVPAGWTPRVLAALDALGYLAEGTVVVTVDNVTVNGETGDAEARETISRVLSEALGDGAAFNIDVTYSEALDPTAGLPTPEECVAMVQNAASENKITFAPSSAEFDPASRETLDQIAQVLRGCGGPIAMEIAGYTDSQGREEMNLALSQDRANAVLAALMSRRILTSGVVANGYGEADPIADNGTEDGREANRRIEFRLISPVEGAEDADLGGETAEEETPAGPDEATPEENAVTQEGAGSPDDAPADGNDAEETDPGPQ